MDEKFNLEEVKKTFPWTEQIAQTPQGCLVRVVDRNGHEVPIFTMTKFLMVITQHMDAQKAAGQTK